MTINSGWWIHHYLSSQKGTIAQAFYNLTLITRKQKKMTSYVLLLALILLFLLVIMMLLVDLGLPFIKYFKFQIQASSKDNKSSITYGRFSFGRKIIGIQEAPLAKINNLYLFSRDKVKKEWIISLDSNKLTFSTIAWWFQLTLITSAMLCSKKIHHNVLREKFW